MALSTAITPAAWAQRAISIRAGLIHHVEGEVIVDGRRLDPDSSKLQSLGVGRRLQTKRGRAELVLAPGRFLRVDRDTELELAADDLLSPEIVLIAGSVIVDWTNVFDDGEALVRHQQGNVRLRKAGRYRVDARQGLVAELRVFDGKAWIESGAETAAVKKRRLLALAEINEKPRKFDDQDTDAFDRWNMRRARVTARESRAGRQRRGGRNRRGGPRMGRGRRGRPPAGSSRSGSGRGGRDRDL